MTIEQLISRARALLGCEGNTKADVYKILVDSGIPGEFAFLAIIAAEILDSENPYTLMVQ